MHFIHSSHHHRRDDTDEHDLRVLVLELFILVIMIALWPTE